MAPRITLLDDPADLTALRATGADADELLAAFAAWAEESGTALYPAQEEALIELVSGANVVLATPTGSGKSLVATGGVYFALAANRRSYYTAPIKALVSEKFFALCDVFGAANVGMLTGDAAVNAGAPIIACTAEILANIALREGAEADIGFVVMDEFHFYGDPDRGWAWQVPLLELPRAQFLLMSATLGDVTVLREDLTRRTGRPTALVAGAERPVPLFYSYATTAMHETIADLLQTKQAPIYVVHFTQAAALERAQALMSVNVSSKEEKAAIAAHIGGFRFTTAFGSTLSRLVRHGIGVHHAGMLPKYRRLVEQLAQAGLLKVICGTDTLGVGINVPIRTVVFSALSKYDGTRTRLLNAREFHQIAGRAGRAGYDTAGTVVVQAPEHEVENLKQFAKVADDPKKRRKLVRRKAPDGMVPWGENTMKRLVEAAPEALTSNMRVSTAMILDVVDRPGDPCLAMRRLLGENHEPRKRQLRHIREAVGIARSLLQAGVLERLAEPEPDGRRYRLTVDLPPDFALNQPLSTFALAAVELLDPDSEDPATFALDVVSVIEATLEDPRQILAAQLKKARGEAVAAMKAEGIEYDERIELLDDITYPRPLDELLTHCFEVYCRSNPWAADGHPAPKSVVREMWERGLTFKEYVSAYGLTRTEGAVLRYLSDAFKALRSGVPAAARTDELTDIVEWLGELVRQVDSSLLDEWEQLTSGDQVDEVAVMAPVRPLTGNERAFTAMVRNALFRRVELWARRRWDELGALDSGSGWTAQRWEAVGEQYFAEHEDIGTGADARGPAMLIFDRAPGVWRVRQILDDPDQDHDWGIDVEVDLAASDEDGAPVIRVVDAGMLS